MTPPNTNIRMVPDIEKLKASLQKTFDTILQDVRDIESFRVVEKALLPLLTVKNS